jgi:UDP-N-acetylmuramate--alanine ligase
LAAAHNLSVHWYSLRDSVAKNIRDAIQIPGEHNVSNALAAFTAATKVFGIPKKIALRALARYKGAWRRMEYKGRLKVEGGRWKEKLKPKTYNLQPMVYDDYAHHPAEIKATLAAFREKFPHSPLICVFQPHQALRLQKLFKDFVGAFDGADALILLPLYRVRGRDKINPRYTSKTLAAAIQKKYPRKPLLYVANPKKLKPALANVLLSLKPITYNLQPILVMMGAGDIVRFTDSLLKK